MGKITKNELHDNLKTEIENKAENTALTTLNNTVNTHLAENTTGAHKASNISANVTGVTGSDVQTILNNLFQFANNGKTSIANVIGSPALSSDTFDALKTYIQSNKNTLATNLTSKGQSSVGTDTLANLIAKVANVNTGKRSASGTNTPGGASNFIYISGSTTGQYTLTVTGLSFKPSVIIAKCFNSSNSSTAFSVYEEMPNDSYAKTVKISQYSTSSGSAGTIHIKGDVAPASVTAGGFTIPVSSNGSYTWLAIE